MIEQLFL